MIAISQDYVQTVIENYSDDIEKHRDNAIAELDKISYIDLKPIEIDYLNWVKDEFKRKNFLKMLPNDIETFIEEPTFKSVPLVECTDKKGIVKEKRSTVAESVIGALKYKNLRSTFYPFYFREIGIKACVFCNSSLTVSVDRIDNNGNDDVRAKFQVDHFYPKAEFPMLSISLYNLYPSCASCNNVKNEKKVKFNLYSTNHNDIERSNFKFKLSSYDEAKYILNRHNNEIDFDFIEDTNLPNGYFTFQDTFDIKGIYDTQKDLISDLVDKSLVYDFYYKKSLIDNFPKLFLSKEHFERFVLGNYPRVQDIHKRPMSKFMQDIAKDLGLI